MNRSRTSGYNWIKIVLALIIVNLFWTAPLLAAPYTPTSDDEVLEILPNPVGYKEIQLLQRYYKENPTASNSYLLIAAYIKLGKLEGDPRYYGYAEALTKPLLATRKGQPDATLMVLEANILQHRHDFNAALVILNKALKLSPQYADAHLMRAVIFTSRGAYSNALPDCRAVLSPAYGALPGLTCVSMIEALTGHLHASYATLGKYYDKFAGDTSTDEKGWALSILGEMAERLGDKAKAESYFREALKNNPKDYYAMAALSDLLIADQRPQEVPALLADYTLQDNLLLRLAITENMTHGAKRDEYADMMRARIRASEQRHETVHLRDYARFALEVDHDPKSAFRMARDNWKASKEPADALILIQSALAVDDKDAARDVLSWQRDQGYEDVNFDQYKNL